MLQWRSCCRADHVAVEIMLQMRLCCSGDRVAGLIMLQWRSCCRADDGAEESMSHTMPAQLFGDLNK